MNVESAGQAGVACGPRILLLICQQALSGTAVRAHAEACLSAGTVVASVAVEASFVTGPRNGWAARTRPRAGPGLLPLRCGRRRRQRTAQGHTAARTGPAHACSSPATGTSSSSLDSSPHERLVLDQCLAASLMAVRWMWSEDSCRWKVVISSNIWSTTVSWPAKVSMPATLWMACLMSSRESLPSPSTSMRLKASSSMVPSLKSTCKNFQMRAQISMQ
mmetsp:Transcript_83127/g.258596  ORF Transcript_83127/g.258596 Transcript_83127/m.258596 type:complete len:219 (-) Transcript_83127:1587-2243(-)